MLYAALIAFALAVGSLADATLKVTLSGAETFVGVANAVVTATVTNTGDEEVGVLKDPLTVLNKVATNAFAIANTDGARPRFKGRAVKYIPNLDLDVIKLAPGQSVSVEHALADAYDFTVSGPGVYTIDTSPVLHVVSNGRLQDVHATVVKHSARLSGDIVGKGQRAVIDKRATFAGCSTGRQAILNSAAGTANVLVEDALDYLNDKSAPADQFKTWFGPKSGSRPALVKAHFGALANLDFSNFTYDCTCAEATLIASTSPDTPMSITICPSYFGLSDSGANSLAGVLIQQAVQWNIVASASRTLGVGVKACLALAINHPGQAVENADSHEYFAENPDVSSNATAPTV